MLQYLETTNHQMNKEWVNDYIHIYRTGYIQTKSFKKSSEFFIKRFLMINEWYDFVENIFVKLIVYILTWGTLKYRTTCRKEIIYSFPFFLLRLVNKKQYTLCTTLYVFLESRVRTETFSSLVFDLCSVCLVGTLILHLLDKDSVNKY